MIQKLLPILPLNFPSNSSFLPILLILFQFFPLGICLYTSVCQFPKLEDWLGCQRGDQQQEQRRAAVYTLSGGDFATTNADDDSMNTPLNGWFCDPESSISMSEVSALDESIQRLYGQYGQQCVCPQSFNAPVKSLDPSAINSVGSMESSSAASHCWHRFGFAFVQKFGGPFPDAATADQCSPSPTNQSQSSASSSMFYDDSEEGTTLGDSKNDDQKQFELPSNWERNDEAMPKKPLQISLLHNPYNAFILYARNFANVLRERWDLGQCGEDLLLLVVQRPPVQQISGGPLSSSTVRLFGPLPMLFVAPGPLVLARLGPQLAMFVQEANEQLRREGRPLFRVLGQFLLRIGNALIRAQPTGGGGINQRPKLRSHVPLWAWAVFAACGVAFGLMALGLFLIRTGTRRSAIPGGQQQTQGHGAMVARRHWKEEDQPPPQTYVNLVQMLMPHPKPLPINMPQQV